MAEILVHYDFSDDALVRETRQSRIKAMDAQRFDPELAARRKLAAHSLSVISEASSWRENKSGSDSSGDEGLTKGAWFHRRNKRPSAPAPPSSVASDKSDYGDDTVSNYTSTTAATLATSHVGSSPPSPCESKDETAGPESNDAGDSDTLTSSRSFIRQIPRVASRVFSRAGSPISSTLHSLNCLGARGTVSFEDALKPTQNKEAESTPKLEVLLEREVEVKHDVHEERCETNDKE